MQPEAINIHHPGSRLCIYDMFHTYHEPSINKDMVHDFPAEEREVCNFTLHKSTWSIMYGVHICLSKELERVKDKYVVQSRVE